MRNGQICSWVQSGRGRPQAAGRPCPLSCSVITGAKVSHFEKTLSRSTNKRTIVLPSCQTSTQGTCHPRRACRTTMMPPLGLRAQNPVSAWQLCLKTGMALLDGCRSQTYRAQHTVLFKTPSRTDAVVSHHPSALRNLAGTFDRGIQ